MKFSSIVVLSLALLNFAVAKEGSLSSADRTVQYTDYIPSHGMGKTVHNVNVYTGQASYSIPLGGLNAPSGVSWDVGISYTDGMPFDFNNEKYPTSAVGHGWNFAAPSISVSHKNTADLYDDEYFVSLGAHGQGQIVEDNLGGFYLSSNPNIKFIPQRFSQIIPKISTVEIKDGVETVYQSSNHPDAILSWVVYLPNGHQMKFGGLESIRYQFFSETRLSSGFTNRVYWMPYKWDLSEYSDNSKTAVIKFEFEYVINGWDFDNSSDVLEFPYVSDGKLKRFYWENSEGNRIEEFEFFYEAKGVSEYLKLDSSIIRRQIPYSIKYLSSLLHRSFDEKNKDYDVDLIHSFEYSVNPTQSGFLKRRLDKVKTSYRKNGGESSRSWEFVYEPFNSGTRLLLQSVQTPGGMIEQFQREPFSFNSENKTNYDTKWTPFKNLLNSESALNPEVPFSALDPSTGQYYNRGNPFQCTENNLLASNQCYGGICFEKLTCAQNPEDLNSWEVDNSFEVHQIHVTKNIGTGMEEVKFDFGESNKQPYLEVGQEWQLHQGLDYIVLVRTESNSGGETSKIGEVQIWSYDEKSNEMKSSIIKTTFPIAGESTQLIPKKDRFYLVRSYGGFTAVESYFKDYSNSSMTWQKFELPEGDRIKSGVSQFGQEVRQQDGGFGILFNLKKDQFTVQTIGEYFLILDEVRSVIVVYRELNNGGMKLITGGELGAIGLDAHEESQAPGGDKFNIYPNQGYKLNFSEGDLTIRTSSDMLFILNNARDKALIYRLTSGTFRKVNDFYIGVGQLEFYCHTNYCLIKAYAEENNSIWYVPKDAMSYSSADYLNSVSYRKVRRIGFGSEGTRYKFDDAEGYLQVSLSDNFFSVYQLYYGGIKLISGLPRGYDTGEMIAAFYKIRDESSTEPLNNLTPLLSFNSLFPNLKNTYPNARFDLNWYSYISIDERNERLYARPFFYENGSNLKPYSNRSDENNSTSLIAPKLHVFNLKNSPDGVKLYPINTSADPQSEILSESVFNYGYSFGKDEFSTSRRYKRFKESVSFSNNIMVTTKPIPFEDKYVLTSTYYEWALDGFVRTGNNINEKLPELPVVNKKLVIDPVLNKVQAIDFSYDASVAEFNSNTQALNFSKSTWKRCKEAEYFYGALTQVPCDNANLISEESNEFKLKGVFDVSYEENGVLVEQQSIDRLSGDTIISYPKIATVREGESLDNLYGGSSFFEEGGSGYIQVPLISRRVIKDRSGRSITNFSLTKYTEDFKPNSHRRISRIYDELTASSHQTRNVLTLDSTVSSRILISDESTGFSDYITVPYTNYRFIKRIPIDNISEAIIPSDLRGAKHTEYENTSDYSSPLFLLPKQVSNFLPIQSKILDHEFLASDLENGISLENTVGVDQITWTPNQRIDAYSENKMPTQSVTFNQANGEFNNYSVTYFGYASQLPTAKFAGPSTRNFFRNTGAELDVNNILLTGAGSESNSVGNYWEVNDYDLSTIFANNGIRSYRVNELYGPTTNMSLNNYSKEREGSIIVSTWMISESINPNLGITVSLRKGSESNLSQNCISKFYYSRLPIEGEYKPNQWQRYELEVSDLKEELESGSCTNASGEYFLRIWAGNTHSDNLSELFIDDFVVYPEYSNFQLYHYDKIRQLKSTTNTQFKTFTNEFDAFGRVTATRDEDGKIFHQNANHRLGEDRQFIQGGVQ